MLEVGKVSRGIESRRPGAGIDQQQVDSLHRYFFERLGAWSIKTIQILKHGAGKGKQTVHRQIQDSLTGLPR